jgi:DnaJ-class molecular chaperone
MARSDMKSEEKCTVCHGTGQDVVMQKTEPLFHRLADWKPCPACNGTGQKQMHGRDTKQ